MKSSYLPWLKKSTCANVLGMLFFLACITPCFSFSQPFPYKFNYLTVDEGLSHTDANDIAQDKLGYIWVATYFGLDRYDGYTVKRFYNSNEPLHNAYRNRINHISPDDDGNIWLGTEGGLQCFNVRQEKYIDYKGITTERNPGFWKLYKPAGNLLYAIMDSRLRLFLVKGDSVEEQKLDIPQDIQFTDIAVGKNGFIWVSSSNGVWMVDKSQHCHHVAVLGLEREAIAKLYFDNRNNLVLSAGNQLFVLKDKDGGGTNLTVEKTFTWEKNGHLWEVAQHNNGDYWVSAGNGLLRLDSNLHLIQAISNGGGANYLNSNSLNPLIIDRSQCLWVCTFGGGVNYCNLNEKLFYTLSHNADAPNSLSGNHIRSVLEDGENLWIGTTANGLNLYNTKTQTFTYYNSYNSQVRLQNDAVSALAFDNDKNLWIGTAVGIEILKPNGKELWRPAGYESFPTYTIESIKKDYYGNIWFGNHSDRFGVIWKDKNNYYHVKYYGEGYFFLADSLKPQLFVSSTHGLKRIIVDKEGNITQSFDYLATAKPNSLSSNYTYPVCKQNDSVYWVGTIGGGLDKLTLNPKNNAYNIKTYTASYGIFNDVESLEIDNTGNIWIGGNGLQCLDPKTGKLVMYDKNDGLQGNSFKVGDSYKGADGTLYFGGIRGLNYFHPEEIKANSILAKPVLTDITINNQKPNYGNTKQSQNSIEQALGYGQNLSLSYLQNNFVVSFSAMHYANPLRCKYRYRLIGFDKDWQYTDGKKPSAAYSNLNYSSYQFVVEATNNDGIWGGSPATTTITIIPPWWKSDFAKTIYVLIAIAFLLGIYIYQARWYRLKREFAVSAVNEKKREEMHKQREELYQQQLMFFTNISHEFRTPLTLIMGPLQHLMSENKNSVFDSSYQLIYRNAKRLINLVSELMNFKKVADSVIKLQVQPLEIYKFCKNLTGEFQHLAVGKNIQFNLACHLQKNAEEPLNCPFDAQVLEKILFNLLNNAFKYTEEGGEVDFEVFFDIENFKPSFSTGFQLLNEDYRAKKYIYFRVADTGIGISGESLAKIFDRYYRVSNNHLGSGVGLALVKSLTKLHKGDIYVYSERHKGTEIIIGIPWGEENYNDSERALFGVNMDGRLEPIDAGVLTPLEINENGHTQAAPKSAKHILIVDDNQELRSFLKQAFEKHYHIYEAGDGNAAIEIAADKIPDLIISDVMMPGMNGIELCKLVKERFETSHIPFIILSAKDALGSKIEGMESGADYYFAKPLSVDLLLLTVNNIFEQAEKLKQRYTNNYLSEATELVHSEKDKEFLQTLLGLIEENMQEPGLDADFLCERLFISRTKLYQKIKGISDQSVGEFIRTIRLKKAIQIMTHEDIAMNEVADRVGLQSGSNFSRAFKKEYGKSPLQFMQALKKE